MVEDITLTVIKSDGNTGYRERKHDIREYQWWAFGTEPAHPAKWYYDKDQKNAKDGAAGSDAAKTQEYVFMMSKLTAKVKMWSWVLLLILQAAVWKGGSTFYRKGCMIAKKNK